MLEPLAPADARRQREAALLAVAAAEAAVEAESAKPRVSPSQHLLAAYYKLAGRPPPPGVNLPDPSVAAQAVERAAAAAAAAAKAAAAAGIGSHLAGAKPRKPASGYSGAAAGGGKSAAGGWMPPLCGIVVGPFRGVEFSRPEDFAHYHAQPQRVVPLTAQLLGACGYLTKKDAREDMHPL